MNKYFLITLIFFLLIGFFSKPIFADALTVYTYENFSDLKTGEKVPVKIFLNTEGREINVLEGKFKISGPAIISNISTDGSVFGLWPEKPQLFGNQDIIFTGGVEGGVYGKDLRLFNFFIERNGEGKIEIKPVEFFAYLNNGQGTKIQISNYQKSIDSIGEGFALTKVLNVTLLMFILFTLINIWKKIFKRKN